jgi:hypothetical protein
MGSMFGDFVSSSTEKDVDVKERAVTEWDITHHAPAEQRDLIRQYQALGMDINHHGIPFFSFLLLKLG